MLSPPEVEKLIEKYLRERLRVELTRVDNAPFTDRLRVRPVPGPNTVVSESVVSLRDPEARRP